jgi:uncharacterized metal-binding protein
MLAQRTATDTLIRAGIIVLTFGTALTHMSLLFPDLVFLLNGFGYLVLLGALYLPIPQSARHRRMVRWVLIGYTTLTIVLWLLFGLRTTIGYINKLNEIALIVLLLIEDRRMRR